MLFYYENTLKFIFNNVIGRQNTRVLKNSNIYVANRKKKPQNFGLFYWVVMAIQKNSYSTPYLDEREDCCF